ncbi:unnamed protein product, partial [marine sediment metagenome]
MKSIIFRSADALLEYFRDVGLKPGPRTGPCKRTTGDIEIFDLRHYLTTLASIGRLKLPL